MMRFDCDISSFLQAWRKRFHVTMWLSSSSELLQQHHEASDDKQMAVLHVLKRNVFQP